MARLKRPTRKTVQDALTALDTRKGDWLRLPGVTAVDVGFKIDGGELTDTVALRVHVERKRPIAELPESERLNDAGAADTTVGGFPVDVVEATYAPAAAQGPVLLEDADAVENVNRKARTSPLVGGISCGNGRITAGTLGAVVFDTETCRPMILSNWHVLAGASAATVGEAIVQPGPIDGGTGADAVADLTRMALDHRMDAAVATLRPGVAHARDVLGLGAITGTDEAELGMEVVKSGRTTAVTEGVVDGVGLVTAINYGDPGVVQFRDQIRIVPRPPWPANDVEISLGGDSGSIWLNANTNKAVGLHFAGERNPSPAVNEHATCNPIGPVLAEMGCSFLPVLCGPPQPPVPPPAPPEPDPWEAFLRLLCARFPFLCGGFQSAQGLGGVNAHGGAAPTPDQVELLLRLLAAGDGAVGSRPAGCRCDCRGGAATATGADDLGAVLRRLLG